REILGETEAVAADHRPRLKEATAADADAIEHDAARDETRVRADLDVRADRAARTDHDPVADLAPRSDDRVRTDLRARRDPRVWRGAARRVHARSRRRRGVQPHREAAPRRRGAG